MSVINTNILSLVTQNNLTKSQGAMNTAIERLSSGMRINSAKDDAAGQAIANRFTASIRGLTQASRNANDGISMAQTTEGALNEVNTNLQRIRELTVQSANGNNSDADKASMQAEITQRMAEIDRTSAQTDFNGVKVLSSSAKELSVQVGAYDGQTIKIGLTEISSTTLKLTGFNVNGSGTPNNAATQATLTAKLASTSGGTDSTQAGYKTSSKFVEGATVSGTTAFTRTTTTKDASDTAGSNPSRNDAKAADVFGVADGNTTVKLNGGTGIDSYTPSGSGSALRFKSATATSVTTNASAAASLTASMTGTATAEVTLNGASQTVKIDSSGNITNENNEQLYLDSTGNLTSNAAGLSASDKASATSLAASMASAPAKSGEIVVTTQGGSTLTYTTAGSGADTWGVSNSLTLADMQAKSTVSGTTAVVDIDGAFGAEAYTVSSSGATVKQGTSNVYIDPASSGAARLSTTGTTTIPATTGAVTTETETYYVHSNGAVMDGSGNAVYEDSASTNNSGLTLNARSGKTSTDKPLEVLDAALKMVDDLRGKLGAVQNRFDSVIANLGTTIVNQTSARSRIEDADYATEVSNMTRAQILQQAGTSVLAKSNQSTEGVMSLLR